MRIGSEYQAMIPEFGTPPSGESPSLFTFSFGGGGGGGEAIRPSVSQFGGGAGNLPAETTVQVKGRGQPLSLHVHIFTIHSWIAMLLLGYM